MFVILMLLITSLAGECQQKNGGLAPGVFVDVWFQVLEMMKKHNNGE